MRHRAGDGEDQCGKEEGTQCCQCDEATTRIVLSATSDVEPDDRRQKQQEPEQVGVEECHGLRDPPGQVQQHFDRDEDQCEKQQDFQGAKRPGGGCLCRRRW